MKILWNLKMLNYLKDKQVVCWLLAFYLWVKIAQNEGEMSLFTYMT